MFIPALLLFFVFGVYLRTHCASFNINDSGETIMVCDLLTVSHSPGYPLHTLWGRVNCLLPLGQPMLRVTFSSMLTGAVSVVIFYWVLKMMLKGIFDPSASSAGSSPRPSFDGQTGQAIPLQEEGGGSRPGPWLWEIPALFGALIFAFSYQHWFQACGAKGGIYTLNTLLSVCMLWLFFKMRESGWYIKSFLLIGFLYGLSLAHHWPNQIVMAPAYLWFLMTGQKRIPFIDFYYWIFKPIFLIPSAFWFLFSSAFVYIQTQNLFTGIEAGLGVLGSLIAAAIIVRVYNWFYLLAAVFVFGVGLVWFQSPLIADVMFLIFIICCLLVRVYNLTNFVKAVVMAFLPLSIYSYLVIRSQQHPVVNWWNPGTASRLWGTVMREGYKGIGDIRSLTTVYRNIGRYWVHAQHQFGDYFTYFIFALAITGLFWFFNRKQWATAIGMLLLGAGVFSGVILFNNPLEGYQWTLDNFFSPIFMMTAFYAAAGVAGACYWVYMNWPHRLVPLFASAVCLGLALQTLVLNYKVNNQDKYSYNGQYIYEGNDQSRYVSSYDYGLNMLKSADDNAVIMCNGDIDILPIWYMQFVLGKRPQVVSFTMQLIPYDWYRNPLFDRWPFLKVPVGQDVRPETVVQNMIDVHANDRSFYFTNIFTAPWMRDKNPSLPEGFLWRMIKTKGMSYAFTSARLNKYWSTYRLRNLDAPDRGYWDEYTDVMKDSYGIGHHFTGLFAYMNQMPDLALWSLNNALKYRQPQVMPQIYLMLGETYLMAGDGAAAANNYQETIRLEQEEEKKYGKPNPNVPYLYAKLGDAFGLIKDFQNAESAFRTSLSMNPQQKEALDGLDQMNKAEEKARKASGKTL